MFYDAPRLGISALELSLAAPHDLGFRRRKRVISINYASRLYQHAVLVLGECNKIARLELEGFKDLSRDDHLAALAYASDSRLGRRRLHGIFSVAGDRRIAQFGA
jgi:hypothetical protein